jgi:hypothetical protein
MEGVLRFLDTLDGLAYAARLALRGIWGDRLRAAGVGAIAGAITSFGVLVAAVLIS